MILAVTLGGCRRGKGELPEDTPWNHGFNAIMETEEGYYTNLIMSSRDMTGMQSLRFIEKESGVSILLCNKPECNHDGGETCEATYKEIAPINSLLFDGAIYILGAEYNGNNVAINLYRAAPDGSSMDKVGCAIQGDNVKNEEVAFMPLNMGNCILQGYDDHSFIIHKGYAYIPYFLQFGQGVKGVQGSGLCRMNLSTGETEVIFDNTERSLVQGHPMRLVGAGDYVYFLLNATGSTGKTRRYVISTKELQTVVPTKENGKPGAERSYFMFSEDRYYGFTYLNDSDRLSIDAFDAQTMQPIKEENVIVDDFPYDYGMGLVEAFLYDGMFVLGTETKIRFYDKSGTLLGEINAPDVKDFSSDKTETIQELYKICNGKLYFLYYDWNEDNGIYGGDWEEDLWPSHRLAKYQIWHVYVRPLDDVFQGKGEWKSLYDTEGIYQLKTLRNRASHVTQTERKRHHERENGCPKKESRGPCADGFGRSPDVVDDRSLRMRERGERASRGYAVESRV